jgi:putative acyl-CoA dehydrogenase
VRNQPPPLERRNLFADDVPLAEALEREGAGWARGRLRAAGEFWGGEPMAWGAAANEHPPVLHTHDRFGRRRDEVEFHPAWHALMAAGARQELHCLPWTTTEPGAHVARAALYQCAVQAEAGFGCPITMTFAAVPALRAQPELAEEWVPLLTAAAYDPELRPAAAKGSALCGMAMTEKQGGSDVRANTTAATPLGAGGPGAEYELTGHKWFCSAPMCDLFLVLAQTDEGLSCFALPRVLPDGSRNAGFQLHRLKDKLGNRSNASSEIELCGAWARMVGEPGRGVPTIIQMVNHTRLDCVIGAAGGMRAAVAQATWHAAHRRAFGARLAGQPATANVLADLAIEAEAATALAMRLARAYDEAMLDPRAEPFKRLATAVAKYHVCKRVPAHAAEALECLGGNGYVEASGMPRLYREAPLGSSGRARAT